MKETTVFILTAAFIFSSALAFADDGQNGQAQFIPDLSNASKNLPKFSHMPSPPPPLINAGQLQKIVVATSDGGIVIVDGNRIIKFNKDLEITKSIELKDPGSGKKN